MGKQTSLQEHWRTGEAPTDTCWRTCAASVPREANVGATWEGDVSLYERTKIGHGCLGKISLGGVTRQLTFHLVAVVGGRGGDEQEMVNREREH